MCECPVAACVRSWCWLVAQSFFFPNLSLICLKVAKEYSAAHTSHGTAPLGEAVESVDQSQCHMVVRGARGECLGEEGQRNRSPLQGGLSHVGGSWHEV